MSQLAIETPRGRTDYFAGEEMFGVCGWELDNPPENVELRLFWYTKGKGTRDVDVVQTVKFDNPRQTDQREFRLTLPEAPYSFSGKLISLIWALELVAEPGGDTDRLEITITPTGMEIELHSGEFKPAK
mgnify:CR=1 FL=1